LLESRLSHTPTTSGIAVNPTQPAYSNPAEDNGSGRSSSSANRRRKNASKYVGYDKATFRVRPDLLERLRKTSFFSRRDMSEIVNAALEQYLPEPELATADDS
jgi:hypothetical protein